MERAMILSGGGARGAFQIGVWQYLSEIGWRPELVCGSSVGAINAAAMGCGMTVETMTRLWKSYSRHRMYRMTFHKFLLTMGQKDRFHPMMDTEPLRRILEETLDIASLRGCDMEVLITAVNMRTSRLRYFTHKEITVDHLMAASAMPLIFPWQTIDGDPYWDGGVIANTPLRPALDRGAETIVAVLLSPIGRRPLPLPKTHAELAELAFEQFLAGSYLVVREQPAASGARILTVCPSEPLGFKSFLDFDGARAEALIKEGYRNAREQLGGVL
jgi:NTE family protein